MKMIDSEDVGAVVAVQEHHVVDSVVVAAVSVDHLQDSVKTTVKESHLEAVVTEEILGDKIIGNFDDFWMDLSVHLL